ncbi:MAG: EscV/YscV/HrcV family type III secretion system export apparatus protein, partial [Bdellovibrio sp.]
MEEVFQFLKRFERYTKNTDLLIALGIMAVMGVMVIPLPPLILDMALTFSLAVAVLILLVAIYVNKALEFSIFPSLLLITTLYRLALNVATVRLILTHGHEGPDAAGSVIKAFGNFVIGNNY